MKAGFAYKRHFEKFQNLPTKTMSEKGSEDSDCHGFIDQNFEAKLIGVRHDFAVQCTLERG
jgi:hypothetical protein